MYPDYVFVTGCVSVRAFPETVSMDAVQEFRATVAGFNNRDLGSSNRR
jgi:hypothetical protein